MIPRVGRVTKIYPNTGKIQVMYEDNSNTSIPLPMLTMNGEYSMPAVGDKVMTMHMENGSSKGFVLGTYYGGGMQPKANNGYRKDFVKGVYVIAGSGAYDLTASKEINLCAESSSASFGVNAGIYGTEATIGSAPVPEEGEEIIPDSYAHFTEESAEIKGKDKVFIEAEDITIKCSYGQESFENILKRIERIEDELGLPHTI